MGKHIKKEAVLQWSTDHDRFVSHGFNRNLHVDQVLEGSMKTAGFMPSHPLQVKRIEGNRFVVICGHHRLDCAKRLGIPFCYVVDESNTDIFDLEGSSRCSWSLEDFVRARAKAGDKECIALLAFVDKYNLPLGVAVSLFGGESAGSGNKAKQVKAGTFKARHIARAEAVAAIVCTLHKAGVAWSRSSQFVKAISLALCVPEFDSERFCRRACRRPAQIHHRALAAEYLEEIESIYNYHAAGSSLLNVKFRALEESRKRQENFGSRAKR
jgi:hypothetical protein